jgi:hypothetical protein
MRKRQSQICIRITPEEKACIERFAEQCGLSLSEYLRQLAFGYQPKALPPKDFLEEMQLLSEIYSDLRETGDTKLARVMATVLLDMQAAISPGGVKDSNHKDLAGA